MIYPAGLKIYGGWDNTDDGIADARNFITRKNLTSEQIKLRRNFNDVWIETLQEIEIDGP